MGAADGAAGPTTEMKAADAGAKLTSVVTATREEARSKMAETGAEKQRRRVGAETTCTTEEELSEKHNGEDGRMGESWRKAGCLEGKRRR